MYLFRCLVRTEMFVCVLPSFEGRWHGTARLFRDGRFFVAKQHFHRKVKPLLKLHRGCNPLTRSHLWCDFKIFFAFGKTTLFASRISHHRKRWSPLFRKRAKPNNNFRVLTAILVIPPLREFIVNLLYHPSPYGATLLQTFGLQEG